MWRRILDNQRRTPQAVVKHVTSSKRAPADFKENESCGVDPGITIGSVQPVDKEDCSGVNIVFSELNLNPESTLIVGSKMYGSKPDRRQLYPNAVGMDLEEGDGVDFVHNMEMPFDQKFAHVDCCSVLEHCQRPWLMAQNIESSLEDGGSLLVSAPFVWRVHNYPGDFWRITPAALDILFPSIRWEIKALYSNGKKVGKAPSMNDNKGRRWFGRTEVVGFGYKCASIS